MGGKVVAGSLFAILQSWGMTYSVAIPAMGAIITAASAAMVIAEDQFAKFKQWVFANAGEEE
jgi:hypothetical protein